MYLNDCQRYMEELVDEYSSLLLSQLLKAVNHKFGLNLRNLNRYANQMRVHGCYQLTAYGTEYILHRKGANPDYDMIRSFEVLLPFLTQATWHRKGRFPVAIRVFIHTIEHDKEISVIPVQQGKEKMLSEYVNDKFENEKCSIIIFLLETEEQMKKINAKCNYRFALVTKEGVVFYKKE